jgi:hypothetical protein
MGRPKKRKFQVGFFALDVAVGRIDGTPYGEDLLNGRPAYLRGKLACFVREGEEMEKWEPIFWILGSGVGFFILLVLVESLKAHRKKKS